MADHDDWSGRAKLAAQWLYDALSVVDLGCGSMTLEKYLRPEQSYLPVDLARRDSRTVVLDLNSEQDLQRLPAGGAAAILGVLEYSYDAPLLLMRLRTCYANIVISFNVASDSNLAARESHGWVVHYNREELLRAFHEAGFSVARECLVGHDQFLFQLH